MTIPTRLETPHGAIALPAFMPDATRAVVRTLDAADLESVGVVCVMVNALHVASSPGTSLVKAQGGLHAFMGWRGIVATDSGGFQALSLSGGQTQRADVSDAGITFRLAKTKKKQLITPEKSIQRQIDLGADILFCLDECTHPSQPADQQRTSVERTVAWARRCKEEFLRLTAAMDVKPRLLAVVQGGDDLALRAECAARLVDIGFDGYGFGGWPVTRTGALAEGVVALAQMLPTGSILHGLGIGNPDSLVAAWRAGYTLFDCTLPTRDARHQRLYRFLDGANPAAGEGAFSTTEYATGENWARDARPIDPTCDCPVCARYSRAYVRHLFDVGDVTAQRLATMHNLRFYTRLVAMLRETAP